MEIPLVVLAGFLGASVASFGQCVITRTAQGESWISGRSRCDFCHHTLSWYENIPIASYLLQSGKTRCCQKKLSPIYVIGEVCFAVVAGALTAVLG